MIDWNKEKEKLKSLIEKGISYSEIGRMYGISGNAVKKAARSRGITLEPRRKVNECETFNRGVLRKEQNYCLYCGKPIDGRHLYCNNSCQQNYLSTQYIKDWKAGKEDGINGQYALSKRIRHYLLAKAEYKCELCGWGETNKYTGTIPLEVHHKDGNYKNNTEDNLQVLCPNCHSLTETYKSHNKNGRPERRKYSKKIKDE